MSKKAPQNQKPRLRYDKRVYRLWFEFLKRAYQSEDVKVDKSIYADWGDILNVRFKDWWEDHWVDLFAEQDEKPRALVKKSDFKRRDDSKVYLEVPINKPITSVLSDVNEVIAPFFKQQQKGRKGAFPSTAKFKVTQGAEIRIDMFRMMLRCYHLSQQDIAPKDIPDGIKNRIKTLKARQAIDGRRSANEGIFAGHDPENIKTYVRRHTRKARTIIKNVAAGEFPGKY